MSHPHPSHRLRRIAAATTAGALTLLGTPLAPVASAIPEEEAPLWASARQDDDVSVSLTRIGETEVGQDLKLDFEVTNTTSSTVEELRLTTQRGDAVTDAAQVRQTMGAGEFPYYGPVVDVPALEPGETTTVTVTAPTALDGTNTLAITEPGAYPVQMLLTGSIDGQPAALGTERMVIPMGDIAGQAVRDRAQAAEEAPDTDPDQAEERPAAPADLTVIYPLTAEVDVVAGETGGQELILASESLAGELAPEGRLTQLLDIYAKHNLHGAGCVALDPALVDAVDRMVDGYTVSPTRPSITQPPKRLRDSWFRDDTENRGEVGTGSADAAAFLNRLGELDCTLAMPWANADPSAAASVNNPWLTYEALERGAETIERITGRAVDSPLVSSGTGYVSAPIDVPVVVADNSEWDGQAVTFDASLGSLLAQTGPNPQSVGYSNPALRYDYRLDSPLARELTARAGLLTQATHTASAGGAASGDTGTLIAALPHNLDPDAAEAVLDSAATLIDSGAARARALPEVPLRAGSAGPELGSPYEDPAALNVPEVARIEQQARYTDELTMMMENDSAIALTRYGFTLPLRRDLLTAMSVTQRSTMAGYDDSIVASNARLREQQDTLNELRASVSLVPPGNVYTRSSEQSPLLIVASNALPLPVNAVIAYEGPEGAVLNTPDNVRIPAKGSITVTMTADIPASQGERTDLRLWLATKTGETISQPVTIAVQTTTGMFSSYGMAILASIAAAAVLGLLFIRRIRAKKKAPAGTTAPDGLKTAEGLKNNTDNNT